MVKWKKKKKMNKTQTQIYGFIRMKHFQKRDRYGQRHARCKWVNWKSICFIEMCTNRVTEANPLPDQIQSFATNENEQESSLYTALKWLRTRYIDTFARKGNPKNIHDKNYD